MMKAFQIGSDGFTAMLEVRSDRKVVVVTDQNGHPLWEDHTMMTPADKVGIWRRWHTLSDDMLIEEAILEFERRHRKE